MNIPDEYFTDEVPTEPGVYLYKVKGKAPKPVVFTTVVTITRHGVVRQIESDLRYGLHEVPSDTPIKWCRLVPVAELEKLKAENERFRELVHDAYAEGEQDGRRGEFGWVGSVTKSELARLEGRSE